MKSKDWLEGFNYAVKIDSFFKERKE